MSEVRGDACGVAAIYSRDLDAARQLFFMLFALQHRGQESSGIATGDGRNVRLHKRMGLVSQVFNEEVLRDLPGTIGIGHNRYSTTGSSTQDNAQPFIVDTSHGEVAVAHNGNLVNYQALITQIKEWGIKLKPSEKSDSSLIAHVIAHFFESSGNLEAATTQAFAYLQGSFSLVIMSRDTVIGLRDRNGLRPLCYGRLGHGALVIASESCALGVIEAHFEGEVEPGQMLVLNARGMHTRQLAPADPKLCMFEFIYTARPDSILMGRSVYQVRKRFGLRLAVEAFPEADVVIPVPDTAIPVAVGYSHATGMRFEEGLVKSRYINRTFIEPDPHTRHNKVRMKLTPLKSVIAGQRVVLIDDSIVRGTTSKQIVQLVKNAGAKEVHLLISSPPIKYPDFYGIDIGDTADLIAANKSIEEIRRFVGADSLHYLSLEGTYKAIDVPSDHLCTSCFTGEYPVWPEQLGAKPRTRKPKPYWSVSVAR